MSIKERKKREREEMRDLILTILSIRTYSKNARYDTKLY